MQSMAFITLDMPPSSHLHARLYMLINTKRGAARPPPAIASSLLAPFIPCKRIALYML